MGRGVEVISPAGEDLLFCDGNPLFWTSCHFSQLSLYIAHSHGAAAWFGEWAVYLGMLSSCGVSAALLSPCLFYLVSYRDYRDEGYAFSDMLLWQAIFI